MSGAKHVGIVGFEIYFPNVFIDQRDLEKHDGVSEGKYTIGLGQQKMGICSDREDINSLAISAFDRLVRSYNVDLAKIGRLEIGTETLVDKSKSVKSYVMQRFEEVENFDVEGVDNKNACYGGTQAMMNTINWVESSSWDGRLGIVICADIAIYGKGAARPTGGAGAVAMLIGPNAPFQISSVRQNYFKHSFDFYKPDLTSEYPEVDGPLSIKQYYEALDKCYQGWRIKSRNISDNVSNHQVLENLDHICFHCPFSKLVQKSFGRLLYNDLITCPDALLKLIGKDNFQNIEKFRNYSNDASLTDKELEKTFTSVSKSLFSTKCEPSLLVARNVGNMYTPSLYGCLASLVSTQTLRGGEHIGMFSYGSGVCATFYTIKVINNDQLTTINNVFKELPLRLENRVKITPAEMEILCAQREAANGLRKGDLSAGWRPSGSITSLEWGATYLDEIDSRWRRFYKTHADQNQNL